MDNLFSQQGFQLELGLKTDKAEASIKEFGDITGKAMDALEKEASDALKQIEKLERALSRIRATRGQEKARVDFDGKEQLLTLEKIQQQYDLLTRKARAYKTEINKIVLEQDKISRVLRDANQANALFAQGLEKQPAKISFVKQAYTSLRQEIERLETTQSKSPERVKFLNQLHNALKLEEADIRDLISLEAKYADPIRASQIAIQRKEKALLDADNAARAQSAINRRIGVKDEPGEIARELRRNAARTVFNQPRFDIGLQDKQAAEELARAARQQQIKENVLNNIRNSQSARLSSNFGDDLKQLKAANDAVSKLTTQYIALKKQITESVRAASDKSDLQVINKRIEALRKLEDQVRASIVNASKQDPNGKQVTRAITALETPIFKVRQPSQAEVEKYLKAAEAAQKKLAAVDISPSVTRARQLDQAVQKLTSQYLKATKAVEDLKKSQHGVGSNELKQAEKLAGDYEKALRAVLATSQRLGNNTINMS